MPAVPARFAGGRALAFCLLPVLLATWGVNEARADLILTLSSSDDFSTFAVGNTATFNVSLSGVTPAEEPGFLKVVIGYDPVVLQALNITPGSIVPDTAGFDSAGSSPGTVSAFYDDSFVFSSPITTDGVFYSFQVTRLTTDGTELFFASFAAQDDAGNNIALSATPDSFLIPARAVPEPSSILLIFLGASAIAGCVGYVGRRRTASASQ